MKYAIFSDIHGNLEALQEVLKNLDGKVDRYICVGDLVGYGANPNECIEEIVKLNCLTVAGNHDYAAINLTPVDVFNNFAKEAILWTQKELSKENKNYLKNLKLVENVDDFMIVHSTPFEPENWFYIFTFEDALKNFNYFNKQICFIGHSHQPFIIILDEHGKCSIYKKNILKIEKNKRYLINVGSVGQPRDNNPETCFFTLDLTKQEIMMKRVVYDVKIAQQKIINSGLPKILAERLTKGQ